MKIAIIGAGNVGALTAMRIAEEKLGEIILVDIVKGLAKGKVLDLEDARATLKSNDQIQGTEDINQINGADIIIITAGLTRKTGMTREGLLDQNAQIVKSISSKIKEIASQAIAVVVTNPLDLMTCLTLKITAFKPNKVLGMGNSLDSIRFTHLISKELNVPPQDIEACVIGSHGEGMLPLPRFTKVKGRPLEELLSKDKIQDLVKKTKARGAQIVSLLGSGSAFFAPSAAITSLVKAIVKNEKRTLGVSAYLNGEYGIKDICIGVPCRLGKRGIEEIVQLDLNKEEKEALNKSARQLKEQIKELKI